MLDTRVALCAIPGKTGCVSDQHSVSNAISGSVAGAVVQAGSIEQVVIFAPAQAVVPVPRQLPAAVRDFTGRERQVAALDDLLPSTALGHSTVAVLDGTGGVGKSTLVTHWAHQVQDRFGDGTLFVNLRGYGPSSPLDPAVVLGSFLTALGVPRQQVPASSGTAEAPWSKTTKTTSCGSRTPTRSPRGRRAARHLPAPARSDLARLRDLDDVLPTHPARFHRTARFGRMAPAADVPGEFGEEVVLGLPLKNRTRCEPCTPEAKM